MCRSQPALPVCWRAFYRWRYSNHIQASTLTAENHGECNSNHELRNSTAISPIPIPISVIQIAISAILIGISAIMIAMCTILIATSKVQITIFADLMCSWAVRHWLVGWLGRACPRLQQGTPVALSMVPTSATVFFLDVEDFTHLTETLGAAQLVLHRWRFDPTPRRHQRTLHIGCARIRALLKDRPV